MKRIFPQKAFTLSEVLIALTVIGVIAAITVPALVQKTQKQEYVTALKKTYSTLSQAAQAIIAEEGPVTGWKSFEDKKEGSKYVLDLFKQHLNVIKECLPNDAACSPQGTYIRLNGTQVGWADTLYTGYYSAILSDGVQLVFGSVDTACSSNWAGSIDYCIKIYADVNGAKKPNVVGRDLFVFVLKENGLFPVGCDRPDSCTENGKLGNGYSCACQVLRDGAMNY